MSSEIGSQFALAKQYYEELLRLASLEQLKSGNFGAEASRRRVEDLLQKLTSLATKIQGQMGDQISNADQPPIVTVNSGHLAFYRRELEPNIQLLEKAYWEITGLWELVADLFADQQPGQRRSTPVANALSWGLERWITMLEEGEEEDWLERGFDLNAAFEFAQEPLFQPDEWLENRRLLQPVLLDKAVSKIRDHIRYRLVEIYRAFTFGLWMAAVALCRSAIEFAIKDSASRLGIEVARIGRRGTPEDKRLAELISDVGEKLPALKGHLETVRDTGNRVLHPKKRDVIALPKVLRDETLQCIKATKKAIEGLYSSV